MSTKVHDGDDETFDEVDKILETAKAGLQAKRSLERKSRRNINLSDIPENYTHVPASSKKSDHLNPSRSPIRVETPPPPQPPPPKLQQPVEASREHFKAQQRSLVHTALRWFRNRYMGCVSAVDGKCEMHGCCVVTSAVCAPSKAASRRWRPWSPSPTSLAWFLLVSFQRTVFSPHEHSVFTFKRVLTSRRESYEITTCITIVYAVSQLFWPAFPTTLALRGRMALLGELAMHNWTAAPNKSFSYTTRERCHGSWKYWLDMTVGFTQMLCLVEFLQTGPFLRLSKPSSIYAPRMSIRPRNSSYCRCSTSVRLLDMNKEIRCSTLIYF